MWPFSRRTPPEAGAGSHRDGLADLDVAVVHFLGNRPTVATLSALFRHYPRAAVTLIDNSGGCCPAETQVLAHLPRLRDRIRLIVNPARDFGASGGLSHGSGLDLALEHCRARYLVTMEADSFILERGAFELLLALMDAGFDWAGVGQKPVDGRFASFSPSFAVFRADLLRRLGLSFRRRPRPPELYDPADPLIRHHRGTAERVKAGLPPDYPQGKSPDTYRESPETIVERELHHVEYFDTGEWLHRTLAEQGYRGHLFPQPPTLHHVWGSRDEASFVLNFRQALPDHDLNDYLPGALQVATDVAERPLDSLGLVDGERGGLAASWHWHGGRPRSCRAGQGALHFQVAAEDGEKLYLALGAGRFRHPPPSQLGARLAPSSLHRVDCRFEASGNLSAALFVVEYAGRRRLRDHRFALNRGSNSGWFVTTPQTTDFRLLFRFSGEGAGSLADLRLAGGGRGTAAGAARR